MQRRDDRSGVIQRQRRLSDIGELIRRSNLQPLNVFDAFDQMHAAVGLTHRAFDFRMTQMPDHHDLAPGGAHFCDFDVHLCHQGTRCIEHAQPALPCFALHTLGYAVGRENHDAARRNLIEIIDKHRAFGTKIVNDVLVMNNFMPDVNRCAVHRKRPLDDFDRAINAGTETTRLREDNFHRFRRFAIGHRATIVHFHWQPV